MENLSDKLKNAIVKSGQLSAVFILSFMIIVFLIFHKKEAWQAILSVEEFAEHHLFLVLFVLTISVVYLYRKKLIDEVKSKKNRIIKHYKMRLLKEKTPSVLFKNHSDEKIYFINKEMVDVLKFPNEEVLMDDKLIIKRKYDIMYASILGNKFKHKSKIYFKDSESNKCIETTIWHADENFISLKSGKVIPVNRITKIKY